MNTQRRRLLGWPVAAGVAASLPRRARAHAFQEEHFTVLHPWCDEATAGTTDLVVLLRITDISRADRLLRAETPVASQMRLEVPPRRPFDPPVTTAPGAPPSLPLQPGHDLILTPFGPHLLIDKVLTDLHFGREYPLTLQFELAGMVEAALIIGLD
jgi:copper(I)-binding protein